MNGHFARRGGARLWWAVPLTLVVAASAGFAAFALPGLAGGASVPSQLVVHRSPAPSPSVQATIHPSPVTSSAPTNTTIPTPPPTHVTVVVTPQRPVVRESEDQQREQGGSPSPSDAGTGDGTQRDS